MEKIKGMIYRQDVLDALDEIESEVADGYGFQYEKWRKHFCEMTSARPDHIADDSKRGDTINRKSAIEALHDEIVSRRINEDTNDDGALDEFDTEAILRRLPSAQPIIRCKECKHWLDIDDGRQKHRMCADVYGDWFCADAERREDGKTN